MSNCWKGLIYAIKVVKEWVAWNPGNGRQIRLGEDPFVGGVDFYKLFEGIVQDLHQKGIIYLS